MRLFLSILTLSLVAGSALAQTTGWQTDFESGAREYISENYDKAREFLTTALDKTRAEKPTEASEQNAALCQLWLAKVDFHKGALDQAEQRLQAALATFKKGEKNPLQNQNTIAALHNLAKVNWRRGRFEKAEKYYLEALNLCKKCSAPITRAPQRS